MWLSAHAYELPLQQEINTAQAHLTWRQGWWICLHDALGSVIGMGEVAPWVGFGAGPDQVKTELSTWSQTAPLQLIRHNSESNSIRYFELERPVS